MTETTTTTTQVQITPTEAASRLAALHDAYEAAVSQMTAAKDSLDQAAIAAAQAALDGLRGQVRELVGVIAAGREINDERCHTLVVAAAAGATPADLKTIAEAKRASRGAYIWVPRHRYEGLRRGRGWARLGSGMDAVWGERVDGGYRLRQEGRWIVGGYDGIARKVEIVWNVRRVAGVWIAS
jgi:N-formylglutamate amidohydrolase